MSLSCFFFYFKRHDRHPSMPMLMAAEALKATVTPRCCFFWSCHIDRWRSFAIHFIFIVNIIILGIGREWANEDRHTARAPQLYSPVSNSNRQGRWSRVEWGPNTAAPVTKYFMPSHAQPNKVLYHKPTWSPSSPSPEPSPIRIQIEDETMMKLIKMTDKKTRRKRGRRVGHR